jgi:hypothetical protein
MSALTHSAVQPGQRTNVGVRINCPPKPTYNSDIQRSITIACQGVGASARRAERATAEQAAMDATMQQVQLPVRLELKRAHMSRFEVDFAGKTPFRCTTANTAGNIGPISTRLEPMPV